MLHKEPILLQTLLAPPSLRELRVAVASKTNQTFGRGGEAPGGRGRAPPPRSCGGKGLIFHSSFSLVSRFPFLTSSSLGLSKNCVRRPEGVTFQ